MHTLSPSHLLPLALALTVGLQYTSANFPLLDDALGGPAAFGADASTGPDAIPHDRTDAAAVWNGAWSASSPTAAYGAGGATSAGGGGGAYSGVSTYGFGPASSYGGLDARRSSGCGSCASYGGGGSWSAMSAAYAIGSPPASTGSAYGGRHDSDGDATDDFYADLPSTPVRAPPPPPDLISGMAGGAASTPAGMPIKLDGGGAVVDADGSAAMSRLSMSAADLPGAGGQGDAPGAPGESTMSVQQRQAIEDELSPLVRAAKVRLCSRSGAVVLAASALLVRLLPRAQLGCVSQPLARLTRSPRVEVAHCALQSVTQLAARAPELFAPVLSAFFTSAASPPFLSRARIHVLGLLASRATVSAISSELNSYLRSSTPHIAQAASPWPWPWPWPWP